MNPIDEYIRAQDGAIQPRLTAIRGTISSALPDATEKISYQMPTFWKGRNIIHFAAFKNHIGIYPGGEATTVFAERLTDFKTSKGTIQIGNDQELPLELIRDIAVWCYQFVSKGGKVKTTGRLHKSARDKKIAGVCGGIAEYLNIDPTIIRLAWAVLTLGWGTGIVLYLTFAFVLPEE